MECVAIACRSRDLVWRAHGVARRVTRMVRAGGVPRSRVRGADAIVARVVKPPSLSFRSPSEPAVSEFRRGARPRTVPSPPAAPGGRRLRSLRRRGTAKVATSDRLLRRTGPALGECTAWRCSPNRARRPTSERRRARPHGVTRASGYRARRVTWCIAGLHRMCVRTVRARYRARHAGDCPAVGAARAATA